MATIAKTIVATGLSSGLGFEALRQLLEQSQPYRIILGVRNTQSTEAAVDGIKYDKSANAVTVLPLDLADLKGVKAFAQQTLDKVGQDKIDYLLLNAGMIVDADKPGPNGSKYCETYVVNHLSQHYLVHLLRKKLEDSGSRIAVVSSGGIRNITDPSVLNKGVLANSGATGMETYAQTKFAQLLGAHWWRRQLDGKCRVVAVSPGLIPNTGIARNYPASEFKDKVKDHPDAKSNAEGGENILRALFKDDLPEDKDQIFLTSWGDWWGIDLIEKSLDKDLQDKWSPSKEEIEKEAGISS